MKTKLLFMSFVVSLFTASCQKEELIYSCDPDIDKIVKADLNNIHLMTRSDILKFDKEMMRAYYAALSKDQKAIFWQEKIDETLMLEWNEAEKKHLKSLMSFLENNSEIFSIDFSKDDSLIDKFEIFIYKWADYARDHLKWEDRLIFSIAGSGYKLSNKAGEVETQVNIQSIKRISELPTCNCNLSSDFCMTSYCERVTCASRSGCGWLLLQMCNGRCGGI